MDEVVFCLSQMEMMRASYKNSEQDFLDAKNQIKTLESVNTELRYSLR
jgi:hypothetical protein